MLLPESVATDWFSPIHSSSSVRACQLAAQSGGFDCSLHGPQLLKKLHYMLEVRRHSARAKFRSTLKRSRCVAKLGWNVGAVQAGRTPLKPLPVRAVRSRPGYWWAAVRGGEGDEAHVPFNHGLGGLRASSNTGASFRRFTSTPCGPDTVWLGPTERWREAKHRPTTTARV